jgi:hypothetical protein
MTDSLIPRREIPIVRGMGMQTIPDRGSGTVVTPNASSYVYGSWVVIGPGALPWDILIHGITIGPAGALSSSFMAFWQLQLAGSGSTGGAGLADQPIGIFRTHGNYFQSAAARVYYPTIWLPYPVLVRQRNAIRARAASDYGGLAFTVGVNYTRVDDESVID